MLKGTFLRSKIGRRIFCLFISCSIIPVVVLSILSFTQVMRNLEEHGHRRLHQSTSALGQFIIERLLLLDDALRRTESDYIRTGGSMIRPPEMNHDGAISTRFKSICLYPDNGLPVPLLGEVIESPPIHDAMRSQLRTGNTAVITQSSAPPATRILLVKSTEPTAAGILVGELDSTHLWSVGVEHSLPPMTDLCVIDQSGEIIMSSIPDSAPLLDALASTKRGTEKRNFQWAQAGTTHIANYYTLFLKSRFVAANWTVVLSQAKNDLFAPLDNFRTVFPQVAILSLLVVAFLSMYFIRQTLVPLERIKEGIIRITGRDFDARIAVQSKDEFQEVAATFNEMSKQLGKQFTALTKMSEIDRAILSSLDTERIISTVLDGIQGVLSCDTISISLADSQRQHTGVSYSSKAGFAPLHTSTTVHFSSAELMRLLSSREILIIRAGDVVPGYLASAGAQGMLLFLVLPVFVKNRLYATINMGYAKADTPPEDDIVHARQLADQMAVALSNSSLIEELDQLNWGTLTALARTVDAKSSWTAGHSERVFEVAMRVAGVLRFTPDELSALHRGALLHDIGKVGIPNKILDKPSKLTPEEYDQIKAHSKIGARILQPIAAYEEVIPLVLQHHEKFDGTGYPDGLSGENIHLGARVLAVADVFDAMIADRPYRAGLELNTALGYIREGAGTHFDPEVVKAFLATISADESILKIFKLPSPQMHVR